MRSIFEISKRLLIRHMYIYSLVRGSLFTFPYYMYIELLMFILQHTHYLSTSSIAIHVYLVKEVRQGDPLTPLLFSLKQDAQLLIEVSCEFRVNMNHTLLNQMLSCMDNRSPL